MKTGALIVTAGGTDRSAAFDAMLKIGSISALQRICMTFHLCGVRPIVVVVSDPEQHDMEKHLARMPVVFLQGDDSREMLYNVQTGLSYLENQCERVLVTPVNIPLFSVETVKTLLSSGQKLAVPVCNGHGGHPLLLHRDLISAILGYRGPGGLRGAVESGGFPQERIQVRDPGVIVKSEEFEACEKIAVTHSLSQWRPVMKLRIAREEAFLGPGSWQLLSLVESTGSVRIASTLMGISYSKAWKILNNLEEQAGFPVLVRKKGGPGGGESHLTEDGKALMAWFERLESLCNQAVNTVFENNPFQR